MTRNPKRFRGTSLAKQTHVLNRSAIDGLVGLSSATSEAEFLEALAETRASLPPREHDLLAPLFDALAMRRAQVERLTALAGTDALTGVANRRVFQDALRRELAVHYRSGSGLAVLLLDLDGLKELNDTQGHAAGDQAIRAVALTSASLVRETDLVARLGGDEFGVLLVGADEEHARAVGKRVRQSLARMRIEGSSVRVSLGVAAVMQTRGVRAEDLLDAADRDLYADKRSRHPSVRTSAVRVAARSACTELPRSG